MNQFINFVLTYFLIKEKKMENKIIERNSKDEKVNNKDGILKECRDNDKKLEDISKKIYFM